MKKLTMAVALIFTLLAPMSVVLSSLVTAETEAQIVFLNQEKAVSVQPAAFPKQIEKIAAKAITANDMPRYMTESVGSTLTMLIMGVAPTEEDREEEPVSETNHVDTDEVIEDTGFDEANTKVDLGFAEVVINDTSVPVLQEPSGTLATGPFAPSKITLTDEERELVERVIMAEVSGRSYTDILAVAQCIYDRAVDWKKSVTAVLTQKYAFAGPTYKYEPTALIKQTVREVFDEGVRLTVEPIYYFYAVRIATPGSFHETQHCLIETKLHRYFGPALA